MLACLPACLLPSRLKPNHRYILSAVPRKGPFHTWLTVTGVERDHRIAQKCQRGLESLGCGASDALVDFRIADRAPAMACGLCRPSEDSGLVLGWGSRLVRLPAASELTGRCVLLAILSLGLGGCNEARRLLSEVIDGCEVKRDLAAACCE